MKTMSALTRCLTALVLGCAALQCPAAAEPVPVAHSARLVLEATPAAGGITLRVTPAATEPPLSGGELDVFVDGQSTPATPRADGSYFVPLANPAAAGGRKLDVVIAHDGIREVLSGTVPAPAAASPSGSGVGAVLRSHKQLWWWILNITVVLIGALAISRRMS